MRRDIRPRLAIGAARPARRSLLALLAAWPVGALAQRAPRLRIADALDQAKAFLCGDCDNDVEAEGVNQAIGRVTSAGNALNEARMTLEEVLAQGEAPYARVLLAVLEGLGALESLDEATALEAIRAASDALAVVPR